MRLGRPLTYDAVAVLRRVRAPMLWVLAANDTFAPIVTTLQRLRELTDTGQAISVLMYPNTDHGIFEFVSAPTAREQGRAIQTATFGQRSILRSTVI
jgi:uncharacterized protein